MKTESYEKYTRRSSRKSNLFRDIFLSFVVGGSICVFADLLFRLFLRLNLSDLAAKSGVTFSLIFLACLLTGLGSFDQIAKFSGAGTLVPITGFANAMCSPSIDNKAEGFIFGVGAKMFVIAGPVIVYGVSASVIYGVIYWLCTLI